MSESEVERELQELISELTSIIRSGMDPLSVRLQPHIMRLRKLIKESLELKHVELDMEALYNFALLVYAQSKSLKDKSSVLYVDPFLIRLSMLGSTTDKLAEAFLRSWRPSAGRDVLSHEMMRRAYEYWNNLKEYNIEEAKTQPIFGESLESLGVRYDELMSDSIVELYEDLRRRGGRLLYEELLGEGELNERLRRAVLISFMLTYGYASIVKEPLKNRFWVVAKEEVGIEPRSQGESIVTVVS